MLVDKQNELMSDLLFTVHQHGGDDVTWKPRIAKGRKWEMLAPTKVKISDSEKIMNRNT